MKVILDLDTGIDDALAIAYTLGQKKFDLIGITTLFGNVTVDLAVKNTLAILDILGFSFIPVYRGASHPWGTSGYETSEHLFQIHGYNGLGNVELQQSARKEEDLTAVDFLIQAAEKYGSDLILVTAGPLTNLAEALKKAPESIKKIGKIVTMGGAVTLRGNVTPHAEANIFNDVQAAAYCFNQRLPLTLVGLDVTLKTMITGADICSWLQSDNEASRAFVDFSNYYYTNEYGDATIGGALHDPLAVAIALHPEWLTQSIQLPLMVDISEVAYGRTSSNPDFLMEPNPWIQVALDVNTQKFVPHFITTLEKVLAESSLAK
ncbi:nucleoside hydrolase [Vagococcus sp.]|uniref:nucleoside hydrolase n=1 Tax=Vagococcus sp. TaxID=1933889 RepID=UPI003F99ED30